MKKVLRGLGWFLVLAGIGGLINKDYLIGLVVILVGAVLAVPELLSLTKIRKKKSDQPEIILGILREIEDDAERILCKDWVVLDVETTGLSPETDRVIEVAACRYDQGQLVDSFLSLVNPGKKLPAEITKLTGITNADLKTAPAFSEIAQKLKDFIGDLPMVAHNARFDAQFVRYECSRAGVPVNIHYIDTQKLAKWCFYGMQDYKLSTLINELGLLDHAQEHRALSDVEATENLYMRCRAKKEKKIRAELKKKADDLL